MPSQEQEIQETSDSESLTDDSAEGIAEASVEDSVDTSSETSVEDSGETSADTPVEESVEPPEDDPEDTSVEEPIETSTGASEEDLVETSAGASVEEPVETSTGASVEDPEETSTEASEEDLVETSEETSAEASEEDTVKTSAGIPEEDSVETSAESTEEDSEVITSEATVDEAELSGDPSTEETPVDLELQTALGEVEKFKDMAVRAEAEMQNVRRRTERDVENAHKFGLERLLTNILPVIDGLEKTLESAPAEADPVIDGVRLTFKLLQNVLEKESVEVIDPLGEPFNPNEHEAITVVENPDMEPNSVCVVIQKGYKLNQRLVRPAMVMVTRALVDKDP